VESFEHGLQADGPLGVTAPRIVLGVSRIGRDQEHRLQASHAQNPAFA
jgi:hypothetical protein